MPEASFEFRATLTDLEDGLETLHESIEQVRNSAAKALDGRNLMLFETALGEIGANVLTHGRRGSTGTPIEYELSFDGETVRASFADPGPPVHNHLSREMPEPESEDGRGLVLARTMLDELGYERDGEVNRWRLVKRL